MGTGFFKHPERRIKSEYHPTKTSKNLRQISTNGYVRAWVTDLNHPRLSKNKRDNTPKGGRVYEHLLVMEKHIGRYLTVGEVVHHLDGNRTNNDISNLVLCESPSEHSKLHGNMERYMFELIKCGKIVFDRENKVFTLVVQ